MSTYSNYSNAVRTVRSGVVTTHQGGQAYAIDAFSRLRRFLILGSDSNSFYETAQKLTKDNAKAVIEALSTDYKGAIAEIVRVSDEGLAPSNDPALFALALAASYEGDNQVEVRQLALSSLKKVARIGTHLFHFIDYVDGMRGWGRSLQSAVSTWYLDRSPLSLAQQVTKYASRDGWSHRDILRKAHVKAGTPEFNAIFNYVTQGVINTDLESSALQYIQACETAKHLTNVDEALSLISQFNLPREVLSTTLLKDARIWEALLTNGKGMPIGAMLRNLGNLGKHNILKGDAAIFVNERLTDFNVLKEGRVHPMDLLKAKLVYQSGGGLRGDGSWAINNRIVDALEDAFYLSFGTIEPTGKRGLIALDVSGSMTMGQVGGVPGLSPRLAASVMALVTAKVETNYETMAFSSTFMPLNIGKHDSLDSVLTKTNNLPFAGTDCALPMRWAQQRGEQFDYFIVYTDSETGGYNPADALRDYRHASGIKDARLAVNAFVSNRFSIADPKDRFMMDFVGCSSDTPRMLNAFIRGEI